MLPWLIAACCYLSAGIFLAWHFLPALAYLELGWPFMLAFLAITSLLWPVILAVQVIKFFHEGGSPWL